MILAGHFINSEKLNGMKLLYNPENNSYVVNNNEETFSVSKEQIKELHLQHLIQWENKELLNDLMGVGISAADAPLSGINLDTDEENNDGKINAVHIENPKLKLIKLLVPVVLVAILSIFLIIGIKNIIIDATNKQEVQNQEIATVETYLITLSKEIRENKDIKKYMTVVSHKNISEEMGNSYKKMYKEAFPNVEEEKIKSINKLYEASYSEMVKSQIAKGTLKGTVLDGTLKSVQKEGNGFLATYSIEIGETMVIYIEKDEEIYSIKSINNADELNGNIIKNSNTEKKK